MQISRFQIYPVNIYNKCKKSSLCDVSSLDCKLINTGTIKLKVCKVELLHINSVRFEPEPTAIAFRFFFALMLVNGALVVTLWTCYGAL